MAVIINVISCNEDLMDENIYKIFGKIKDKFPYVYSVEKRNIIRDGIGAKISETINDKRLVVNNLDYIIYVETMLRVSLLYYDQLLYLCKKNTDEVILTNTGAEALYIFLLGKIKRNSNLSLSQITHWLDYVFAPITWSTDVIVAYLESESNKIDSSFIEAYKYFKKEKNINVIELSLDNGSDQLQNAINNIIKNEGKKID